MPPLATSVRNAAAATGRAICAAVTGKAITVTDQVYEARMQTCLACPHVAIVEKHNKTWHRCSICTCWLDGKHVAKARLATEDCPLAKWPLRASFAALKG